MSATIRDVAKLAGVPDQVIRRARDILSELEQNGWVPQQRAPAAQEDQLGFGDLAAAEAAEALRRVDINTLTPIEAMNLIFQLKQKL